MKHYLVFAGTTEGRLLTEHFIKQKDIKVTACTATEYGGILMPTAPNLTVISKRLNEEEMFELMEANVFDLVYDTTHPYAVIVSENIKAAAYKANVPYHRVLRPQEDIESKGKIITAGSIQEAVAYLKNTTGNILCTTGSKEIAALCELPDFQERVYARILPNPQMVADTFHLGFQGQHLICMQGPFSEELNTALIHQFQIQYLLTKNSGRLGGLIEKINSAANAGITLVMIGRPVIEEGERLEDIIGLPH
ncbi:precorrin-6A reductase [[Clostridium] polysaccharolyticum]|uniref:Precorrin-6x reductase n=1 Tax=[Clostridium] polysaccharolyticum TaxID=29364 RepID=A0A1H9Y453_9FIRM|nr:precorrin-6A reductase [[Clostridium] polysaccharolyticum]SES63637.1 precorrin-6x reductase [[Clostridium] polysaccharolyticum]